MCTTYRKCESTVGCEEGYNNRAGPFALSKEKVTCGVGLLNLLQFAKDTAPQTNRAFGLLFDKNIHYRILKLLYGAKNKRWNRRAYLRYVPVLYRDWHAYKFVVTHIFWLFWPIFKEGPYQDRPLLCPSAYHPC